MREWWEGKWEGDKKREGEREQERERVSGIRGRGGWRRERE